MRFSLSLLAQAALSLAQLSSNMLEQHVDSITLEHSFNPVQEAYWTGYPHHRRTPFALSPDGSTAYLAYLDASGSDVHVQAVDPKTFASTGTPVTVSGAKEAGGLVAHDDGFALLTNEALPSGTSNAHSGETPVPVLYRYTSGEQSWKTFLGGPGVGEDFGLVATPDLNGDLVFSAEAGYYAAYFVVTAYTGSAAGHFGDAIRYVTTSGTLETIPGASSNWGCSHNTGIAFEAADAAPFASICAEDQGAIWLNSRTQGMGNNGVKLSNENVINGGSNEPMGGTSGSYSGLARFIGEDSYIFSYVSRGAMDLTRNEWMGDGYTKSENRTSNRNVAITLFSDKFTIVGEQATSEVGAEDGDSQVNWVTEGSADCSNAHVAAFDGSHALVTWEEIERPICDYQAMGCRGDFTGTFYQLVDGAGKKVGEPVKSMDSFVAGDMVTMADGRICWPYVNMEWRLDAATRALPSSTTSKMSFACVDLGGAGAGSDGSTTPSEPETESAAAPTAAATTAAPSAAPTAVSTPEASPVQEEAEAEDTLSSTVVPVPSSAETSAVLPVGGEAETSAALPVDGETETDVSTAVAPVPEVTEAPEPTLASSAAPEVTSKAKSCRPKTRRTVTEVFTVTASA